MYLNFGHEAQKDETIGYIDFYEIAPGLAYPLKVQEFNHDGKKELDYEPLLFDS